MTQPRRVAIWNHEWLPKSETFIMNQVAAIQRWDVRTVGVRPAKDGLPVTADFAPYGSRLPVKAAVVAGYAARYDRRYRRYLRESDVQLVHAHFARSGMQALPVARALGVPLVVTFHGYDATGAPSGSGLAGAVYRSQFPGLVAYATKFVAVSEYIATKLVALGIPPDQIVTLPVGIPVPPLAPSQPDRAASGRQLVLFVGRLVEKKGVDDLLRAIAHLPTTVRDRIDVRIVGYGPLRESLEKLAGQLGVKADFMGAQRPEQVRALMASASVFVAPSKTTPSGETEGLPTVIVEAAGHGVPVVSTRHAGIPESVVDGVTGLLVDEGDVVALGDAVLTLLDDPELAARYGVAGRARVQAHFNIATQTALLESVYDSVTGA